MTDVPALPSEWTVGKIRASNLELERLVIAFLRARPTFKGRQTSSQNLNDSTYTSITFDVEDVDSADGHSTITNTSRYTAVYAGWYLLGGGVTYATNAVGYRQAVWAINGSIINDGITRVAGLSGAVACLGARPTIYYLSVGDYVELQGWQSSTGVLATSVATGLQSSMTVTWISA